MSGYISTMKAKILFLFLISIFCVSNGFAQWEWKTPLPQGNPLTTCWFLDQNTGFAAGYSGTIMKTTDGGQSWNIKYYPGAYNIKGICFPDENTGYTIEYNGTIYKTTDGGETWSFLYALEDNNPASIFFTGADTGFIAYSYGGKILKTVNGGLTWISQCPYPNAGYTSIWFPSDQIGFVVGATGFIMRTSNGGNTWIQQSSGTGKDLNSVRFISATTGFAVGDSGAFLKTSNGGLNWNVIAYNDSTDLTAISPMNKDTILATGRGNYWMNSPVVFIRTLNGGASWIPVPVSNDYFYPQNIFSLSSGNCYMVGWYGMIMRSADFGATWENLSSCITGGYLESVHFPSPEVGYATGIYFESPNATLIKTTDGGDTWFPLDSIPDFILPHSIWFPTDDYGFVAGSGIYSTYDGGHTWNERYPPPASWEDDFHSICITANAKGIAVGDNGMIIRSADYGQSWAPVTTGNYNTLTSVCFPDPDTGYAVGDRVILKTTDAGLTWSVSSFSRPLSCVYFVTPQLGFATGDGYNNNIVIKTTDGGASWTAIVPGGNYLPNGFTSVRFYDADTGYIVGNNYYSDNVVLKTTDGGSTWNSLTMPTNLGLTALFITHEYKIFIAGSGVLLSSANGGYTGFSEPALVQSRVASEVFPNPSSASATIKYTLNTPAHVVLSVYNLSGKEIITLSDKNQASGTYTIPIITTGIPAGLYFYRLKVNDSVETGKLVVAR
jgi:photosystem II stability/assembly factor-like uncharacterized protein